MRLVSKSEYLIIQKGTKFTVWGKVGLNNILKYEEMEKKTF